MKNLEGKVAIITGAAGDIGSATARLFVEGGAKVMLVGRTEDKLQQLKQELNSDNVAFITADVTKAKDTLKYVKHTKSTFGGIDILFSNAGVEGAVSPIESYPEEIFDKVIDVNLKGVWLSLQHTIHEMNDGGSIVITSSVAGLKGFEGLGAYVASKHGVVGIMRTAALEFAHRKIRVNTVHPGPVDNQMMRRIEKSISPGDSQKAKQEFENNVPLGRYSTSKEIANLIFFLVSERSKNITGCTYVIDGGMITA